MDVVARFLMCFLMIVLFFITRKNPFILFDKDSKFNIIKMQMTPNDATAIFLVKYKFFH